MGDLIFVSYSAEVRDYWSRDHRDPEHPDNMIVAALGVETCGAGMGFGMRDLEFDSDEFPADAETRLKALPFPTKVVR